MNDDDDIEVPLERIDWVYGVLIGLFGIFLLAAILLLWITRGGGGYE